MMASCCSSGSRQRTTARSGYSLIELVSLLMAFGSIMTLTGVVVHRCTQTQKLVLSNIRHTKSLDDLHHRLLVDTRAAKVLRVVQGTIQLPANADQTIEYSLDNDSIVRTLKSSQGAIMGQVRWWVGAKHLDVELDSSGVVPLAKFSLRFDPQQLNQTTASVANKDNLSGPPAQSAVVQTIHWVSRVGVTPP